MGWNQGYTIFEQTVVGAYDLGLLSKDLLRVLMEPYRGSDIDSGGEMGLIAGDGLDVRQIVLKTWGLEIPEEPDLPEDYEEWTKEQDEANNEYHERLYDAFRSVTKQFGWR